MNVIFPLRFFCVFFLMLLALRPQLAHAQTPALQPPPAEQPYGLWYTIVGSGTTEGYATPDAACRRQFERYRGRGYLPPIRVNAKTYNCRWTGGLINATAVKLECYDPNWAVTNAGVCLDPQNVTPEPDCPCPGGGAAVSASPQPTVGNPVLLSTGAKIDSETDYQTADGLLKVERLYRSRQRGRVHSADHEMPGFGENWHGIVPARLLVADNSATMELHMEAGGIDYFSQATTNSNDFNWVQNGINRRKLSMVSTPATDRTSYFIGQPSIANGAGEVRLDMANGEYMLFRRSDVFKVVGSLRYMVPVEHGLSNGYVRYFDYPDTGEYPNRVRDNLGRQLDLNWRDVTYYPGQYQLKVIDRVNLPDGTALTYDYAVANKAAAAGVPQYGVGGSADRLEKVRRVDAAGATLWGRDYLYEDVRFPYAMTGMKDQNGARLSTYSYSNAGLVAVTERAGGVDRNSIEYLQDAPGQTLQNYVRKVTGPLGHKQKFSFERNSSAPRGMAHVLKKIEGEASSTVPAFTETYGYASTTTTSYDNTLSSMTDRNGNVSTSTLDMANRRPNAIIDASGRPESRQTDITYWPNSDLPASITRGDLKTEYTYTTRGQILTETLTDLSTTTIPYATGGQSRTTVYAWKPNGRLESINGPLPVDAQGKDDTATFEYDPSGNLLSVTNGLGHITRFSDYDLNGRPQQSTDANNVITRFEYDLLGRLKSATVKHPTTPAEDAITLFDYDIEGRVTRITRPATDTLIMDYNLAGQLTAIRAASGERIDFEYNAAGGVESQTVKRADATPSQSVTRTFDSLNRMLTETLGVDRTTTWAYDKQGNPERVTSARANATIMAFDGLNRLITTTHPGGGSEGLAYTPLDDVESNTDAIAVTTNFVRNGFGDVIQEVSPDRGTSVYYYDAAGRMSAGIDSRNQRIDYTRDILGRVTSKTPVGRPESEVVSFTYDDTAGSYPHIGRLTAIADSSGITRFQYDHRGNLTSKRQAVGTTASAKLSYQYDLSDRIVQLTYPSGRLVAYDRDSKGRIVAIRTKANAATAAWTNVASGMAYEPFASLKSATLGNTLTMANSWGNDGRLAFRRLKTNTGKNQSLLSYSYDNDDNITRITDGVNGANSLNYGYDVRGRLSMIEQSGSGQIVYNRQDYLHDANGNRTALERRFAKDQVSADATETYALTPGTNRLSSISGDAGTRSIQYDARGNMQSESRTGNVSITVTALYDGHARLISLARTGEDTQTNVYNGMDQRVVVTSGTVTRRFVYDPDGRVLGEYGTSASDVIAERIWMTPEVAGSGLFGGDDGTGGYAPIAIVTGNTLSWVHANHLGVPQLYTDASGAAVATPVYTLPGFPGQFRTFADIYYNQYRDYDTSTGRYLQADPIGLAGGASPYSYAMGNPLRYTDPDGLTATALTFGQVAQVGFDWWSRRQLRPARATPWGRAWGAGEAVGAAAAVGLFWWNLPDQVTAPAPSTPGLGGDYCPPMLSNRSGGGRSRGGPSSIPVVANNYGEGDRCVDGWMYETEVYCPQNFTGKGYWNCMRRADDRLRACKREGRWPPSGPNRWTIFDEYNL
jgi:RHS repeat-associated protein